MGILRDYILGIWRLELGYLIICSSNKGNSTMSSHGGRNDGAAKYFVCITDKLKSNRRSSID